MIHKLKDIIGNYGYFHFKIWILNLAVFSSFFFIDIRYFGYSLLIWLFYMPLIQLIHHEYVSHQYIQPKNRWIDLVCLFLLYFANTSAKDKHAWHIDHHLKWQNPDQDPIQQKMSKVSIWRYVFGFQEPVSVNIPPKQNVLLENNQWVRLFDTHVLAIYLTYVIVMFIVLPVPWFFIICIYVPWISMLVANFHDHLFHGQFGSQDHNWYLPVFGNAAWHCKHHEEFHTAYYGPGQWKWVNLLWYYQLLLFKPVRK